MANPAHASCFGSVPMDEEAAFLKSVDSAPRDHLPRLVYADWLDEQERPDQAEFLRLLCQATQRSRHSIATRKRLGELRMVLDGAWASRVKRGLHELASQGELLDAAWRAFSRHSLGYHAWADEHNVRGWRTPGQPRTSALVSLRRKCPGFTRDEYQSAFDKCHTLYRLTGSLVGKHGDRWLADYLRAQHTTTWGLVAKEYDHEFRLNCPDFKLSTCRHALLENYVNLKIR